MHASKEWGKLSNEEQQEKIKTIAELLKNKGLDKVKVSAQEHIVCPLKSGAVQKQAFLNVEGSVNKE